MIDDLVSMFLRAFALDVPLAWNTLSGLHGWLLLGQIVWSCFPSCPLPLQRIIQIYPLNSFFHCSKYLASLPLLTQMEPSQKQGSGASCLCLVHA